MVELLQDKEGQEGIIEAMSKLKLQYVTDENGKKTAVILPINEYEKFIEDIQDLAVLAERREEPPISHEEVVAKLKQDGYL